MASIDQPNNTKIAAIEAELNTCMKQLHAIEEVNTQHITTATSHTLLGSGLIDNNGMSRPINICDKTVTLNIEQHIIDDIVAKSIIEATKTKDPKKTLDESNAKERVFDFMQKSKAFNDWQKDFESDFFESCSLANIYIKSIDIFGSVSGNNGFIKFETDLKYTEEYQAQYKQRALKSKINGIHQAYMNLAQFKLGDTKDPQHINDQLKRSHEYIDSLIKTDGELDTAKIKECKAILKKEIDISQKLVDDKQATVDTQNKKLTDKGYKPTAKLEPPQEMGTRQTQQEKTLTLEILNAETKQINDAHIPSIVFMRGGSVAILIKLSAPSGMAFSILVTQPRVPIGKFAIAELPAGMVDSSNNFAGAAAKEIEEETGLIINSSSLQDLTNEYEYDRVYPSCGGCDEFMKFYYYEASMSDEAIMKMKGKCTGAYDEGENIKVMLVPFDRLAEKSPDMKTLTALYLYEQRQKRIALLQTQTPKIGCP